MAARTASVLKRIAGAVTSRTGSGPLAWQPSGAAYPPLLDFAAEDLRGRSGIYLLWHLGVRPQWIRAGLSLDLAEAIKVLQSEADIVAFRVHDGPFLSWTFCSPREGAGIVQYLSHYLNPVLQGLQLACDAATSPDIAAMPCVLPAGTIPLPRALNTHADRN